MTRHEFLAALHALLKPDTYLEIGVHTGASLRLALPGCRAVGVDPNPQVHPGATGPDAAVVSMTSDMFFTGIDVTSFGEVGPVYHDEPAAKYLAGPVDLAFIDGMHLVEYVLRDLANIERHAHPGAVVVLDDVLPRNQGEAHRVQCPGDWTGDVWKVIYALRQWRPDLTYQLVDTQPTGSLVVTGLNPENRTLTEYMDRICDEWVNDAPVPDEVLFRVHAVSPAEALAKLGAR